MRFGLVFEDTVVEVITPAAGKTIDDYVSADRASDYFDIPDHVTAGYVRHPDGHWLPPTESTS